ncbi:MAG: hypothetical protein U0103_16745 [Candidatus Obscuribacterales bacterium]
MAGLEVIMEAISIKNGNLYVGRELYTKFFSGIETIALLKRDTGFLLMPHQPGKRRQVLKML